jgi:glycosyltransferase involved in cell wall biosynthesis
MALNSASPSNQAKRPIKVLYTGDFSSASGPANANRQLISGLRREEHAWSRAQSKLARILTYLIRMPAADAVCFTSASYFNMTAIRLAKRFGKNTYYFMHGCGSFEYEQNEKNFDPKIRDTYRAYERTVFAGADRVFCVSKKLADLMKAREPEYKDKFDVHNIGVDRRDITIPPPLGQNDPDPLAAPPARPGDHTDLLAAHTDPRDRIPPPVQNDPDQSAAPPGNRPRRLLSTGGALPQKGNLFVCEAIHKLRTTENLNIHYTIVGPSADAPDPFRDWPFVEYHPFVPHDQLMTRMKDSELFIQNSVFDSFSIAVLEGLCCGCSLLMSGGVGVAEALAAAQPSDIITNCTDIDEIAEKIKAVLHTPNHKRIMDGVPEEQFDPVAVSRGLYEKICADVRRSSAVISPNM